MTASIGIWAHGGVTGERVHYRWEADQQTGFVTFEVSTRRFWPSDDEGKAVGDLLFDANAGNSQGTSAQVDKRLFSLVVASILRHHALAGQAPSTAHAYLY